MQNPWHTHYYERFLTKNLLILIHKPETVSIVFIANIFGKKLTNITEMSMLEIGLSI